ncbi:glycosyltransferase [Spirochaetia bacterium 38H-sp]|uniref:Glycosyltransferase n=1 Tax=Rarispira pelagica TaxID=3141764 RepID=A0ABU9UC76_9SPIR
MNIAIFMDCYPPMKNGVISSALMLKRGLEARGHKVVVVSVNVEGKEIKETEDTLLFPQISLDFGSKQGFGYALINRKKLINFLNKHNTQLIHIHTEFPVGKAGIKAAKKLGIPYVATSHTLWEQYSNYSFLLKIKPLVRTYLKNVYKKAEILILPSLKLMDYYRKLLGENKRIEVVPNPMDTELFLPMSENEIIKHREKLGIARDAIVINCTGRVGPEKRVIETFFAMAKALKKSTNAFALIVGDGPELEKLKKIAEKEGLSSRVIFTGFVNWEEIKLYYGISDIYVTASTSEIDGLTPIEAALCGNAIVVRRDLAFSDKLEPGKSGFFADTDEELADYLIKLIEDRKLLESFKKFSPQVGRKRSIPLHAEKMEAVYIEAISSGR